MASRLFNAIVGAGIALGTTSLACGDVRTRAEYDEGHSQGAIEALPPTPPVGDSDAAAAPDGSLDASVVTDAAPEISDAEAIHDAFCDAPWPTTKGSPVESPCPVDVADASDAGG
jgi:hypothetical protein